MRLSNRARREFDTGHVSTLLAVHATKVYDKEVLSWIMFGGLGGALNVRCGSAAMVVVCVEL